MLLGTIARKKKTLNNLMDTISKVCKKEIVPNPNLVTYPECEKSPDVIVSAIMKRAEKICTKVCTFEDENHTRKR